MIPLVRRRDGRSKSRNRASSHRTGRVRSRRLELLESRRLLIAQGETFNFTEDLDTSGLLGDVSAQVRWGDETSSAATSVTGGNETGDLRIVFDYSLDTNNFFSSQSRRDLLQIAADSLVSRLGDDLATITPTNTHQWDVSVMHPSSDPPNGQSFVEHDLPSGPAVPANTIIIFAGARDLDGAIRGAGGSATKISIDPINFQCQTQSECDQKAAEFKVFQNAVVARGNAGGFEAPYTDFAPSIGSISFDNTGTDWYFGLNENDFPAGQKVDFLTVATHELAHTLGFGVSPSWSRIAAGGSYQGPAANAAYEGNSTVPLQDVTSGTPSHWNDSVVNVQPSSMTASLNFVQGERTEFSSLDFAGLTDIGWDVLDMNATVTAGHQYNMPGEFVPQVVLTGSQAGQIIHTLDPVTVTAVTQSLTASFANAEVSEGSTGGVGLTVVRGDVVTTDELLVTINGGPSGQLNMPATITIPANNSQHTIQVLPVNDDIAELSKELSFTFTAANHETGTAGITVLDDEPPLFQNPNDRFDVSGSDGAKASDALRVINALRGRSSPVMDPETEQPNGVFYDVNGDYQLTALDALNIINELPNRDANGAREPMIQIVAQALIDADKDQVDAAVDAAIESGTLF